MIKLLIRLWAHLNLHRKKQLKLLLLLMLFASIAEMISIGSVFPFLGILISPQSFFQNPTVQPIIRLLGITSDKQLLIILAIFFGLSVIIAAIIRLILLWALNRLSFAIGSDISANIYQRMLYQPYIVHCMTNSSEIISSITNKSNIVIFNCIIPILTFATSAIILTTILFALLIVKPIITILFFSGVILIYVSIIYFTRKNLQINSQNIATESTKVIKALQEGLGGIRDVLIGRNQAAYSKIFIVADAALRRAQGSSLFVSSSPRYIMESLGILIIIILSYSLSQQPDGIMKAISMLGALTLTAQRLLPLLQQAYSSWSAIKGAQYSLQDILVLLDQPLPYYSQKPRSKQTLFNHKISIKNLSFRYSQDASYILKGLNLEISKGSRVGFYGLTGSGKSTLLDIIMGLLEPTDGSLEIDGQIIKRNNLQSWQEHIAHVPQTIFLTDSSVEENIAFGLAKNEINHARVREAAKLAQIAQSIESWPKKYQTFVGERGIRLSGGQRQRIGIARALYKQADVIVLDEATSALDSKTEKDVMNSINSLSKNITILVIAHRLSTLKNCTQIIKIDKGIAKSIGNYKDIISKR